ncbi:MAG: glycosyltransferase, partial [Leeuwenhoekiella sp.]
GTFSYALSCGCPIISTPIPHVLEVLTSETGIVIDFQDPVHLAQSVIKLLSDTHLRNNMSLNAMHASASTAWENAAIAHMRIFEKLTPVTTTALKYGKPDINLSHLKKMTTDLGIIQFSVINHPDIDSGYTLDDNARALIAAGRHFALCGDETILPYVKIYIDFIHYCHQGGAKFLNYVDENKNFTDQNQEVNLEDSIGRAFWALGYFISQSKTYPESFKPLLTRSQEIVDEMLDEIQQIYSTRAMAFAIKGLYFYSQVNKRPQIVNLISEFGSRMQQMYRHESSKDWLWYESYLTYGNSVLPDAMLCAFLATGNKEFKQTAKDSFNFLLSKIYCDNSISVISNKNWCQRDEEVKIVAPGGEQPIDVAYTILALKRFNQIFPDMGYDVRMEEGFNWFLGDNHLDEILYNPCTGGCYDGLEEHNVNLNQGAESTISYLLSRMAFGYKTASEIAKAQSQLLNSKKLA